MYQCERNVSEIMGEGGRGGGDRSRSKLHKE